MERLLERLRLNRYEASSVALRKVTFIGNGYLAMKHHAFNAWRWDSGLYGPHWIPLLERKFYGL